MLSQGGKLMEQILTVSGLKKSYGKVQAVKGISFYVDRGSLFAFLGPNGAGKSTTIDMICTLLQPDDGEIFLDGKKIGQDDDAIRSCIGVVFQDSVLDDLLTVKENLEVRGSFYGLDKAKLASAIKFAVDAAGVGDFLNRPYGKLSGGQRRRADIARALINTPKILFLDEPTTGLDPQTRQSVWDTIHNLQKQTGMTVFLTTHYMEEAAKADYVVVIDNGLISAKGTPAQLREQYSVDRLYLQCVDTKAVEAVLNSENIQYKQQSDRLVVPVESTMAALPILNKCSQYLLSFEVVSGTMDDAFIAITGKEMRN